MRLFALLHVSEIHDRLEGDPHEVFQVSSVEPEDNSVQHPHPELRRRQDDDNDR